MIDDDNNIKYKQYIDQIKIQIHIHTQNKMHRTSGTINPETISNKVSLFHNAQHPNVNTQHAQYYQQNYDQYQQQSGDQVDQKRKSKQQPLWMEKQKRKKNKKQIFGEHYNYNYRKPNQHKMYRIQQNRNTQIQRANRILLQKIQTIFKRSMGKRKARQMTVAITSQAISQAPTNIKTQNIDMAHKSANHIKNKKYLSQEQELLEQNQRIKQKRTNRNSTVDRLGNLNKDIELAKKQVYNQQRVSKNLKPGDLSKQTSLNRNLIKLSQIQALPKNKRFHTQMNHPITTKNPQNKTGINKVEPGSNNMQRLQSRQNHMTSRKNIGSSVYNITPILQQKPPKIILFKQNNVKVNDKIFNLQAYVQAISYNQQNQQFHQLITMPYNNYQQLYKAKLSQNHQNIIQLLEIEGRSNLLQIRGFQRKYMDVYEQGQVQVNVNVNSKSKSKTTPPHRNNKMQQDKKFIVHYNNNPDDTFDRITIINSQHNTNTIPPSINQLQQQLENKRIKNGNGNRYKQSAMESRVSKRRQDNQKGKDKQAIVQTKRKINTNPNNKILNNQPKSQTVPLQNKSKIIQKQICTMTDNILPKADEQEQSNDNDNGIVNNSIVSMNSSNMMGNSKLSKKQPRLSSNMINIQIQPTTPISNRDRLQIPQGQNKKQQHDSSFFSDITTNNNNKVNKNKDKLQKQQEQLLLDNVPKTNTSNKINNSSKKINQYQDIEDMIQDS